MGYTLDIADRKVIVGAVKKKYDSKKGLYLMTEFSNYGDSVDICAPGKDISVLLITAIMQTLMEHRWQPRSFLDALHIVGH